MKNIFKAVLHSLTLGFAGGEHSSLGWAPILSSPGWEELKEATLLLFSFFFGASSKRGFQTGSTCLHPFCLWKQKFELIFSNCSGYGGKGEAAAKRSSIKFQVWTKRAHEEAEHVHMKRGCGNYCFSIAHPLFYLRTVISYNSF